MKTDKKQTIKFRSLKRRFLNYKVRIIVILFIYPYMVGYSPDSTSVSKTIVDLLIGTSSHSHVTYDCSGNATSQANFRTYDYGASISHNYKGFKFGAKGGGYSIKNSGYENYYNNYYINEEFQLNNEDKSQVQYINPFIGGESKYFELNLGLMFFFQEPSLGNVWGNLINTGKLQPTWLLRIGNREKFHFSTQYLSNVPIFSGGGMADAGFGFGGQENRNLTWVGASFGPFQNLGFSIKQNLQIAEKFDLLLRGRAGMIEGEFEGGVSAGLRLNL